MSKKLTLVLISVLLIASLLVGCGGSNVDGPGNTEPTPEPATANRQIRKKQKNLQNQTSIFLSCGVKNGYGRP